MHVYLIIVCSGNKNNVALLKHNNVNVHGVCFIPYITLLVDINLVGKYKILTLLVFLVPNIQMRVLVK